jgi:hypothetical protein
VTCAVEVPGRATGPAATADHCQHSVSASSCTRRYRDHKIAEEPFRVNVNGEKRLAVCHASGCLDSYDVLVKAVRKEYDMAHAGGLFPVNRPPSA